LPCIILAAFTDLKFLRPNVSLFAIILSLCLSLYFSFSHPFFVIYYRHIVLFCSLCFSIFFPFFSPLSMILFFLVLLLICFLVIHSHSCAVRYRRSKIMHYVPSSKSSCYWTVRKQNNAFRSTACETVAARP
jgi:hypothetical protein